MSACCSRSDAYRACSGRALHAAGFRSRVVPHVALDSLLPPGEALHLKPELTSPSSHPAVGRRANADTLLVKKTLLFPQGERKWRQQMTTPDRRELKPTFPCGQARQPPV